MEKYNFFRIIRTASSEAYGIRVGDDVIGRFDLHHANDGRIDSVVTMLGDISDEEALHLIQEIDLDFVENAEINDDNFSVTFFNAKDSKVYGKDKD